MPNENCLKGIRCPECGQEDKFKIVGVAVFTVTDEGTDEFYDVEWDDDSTIRCTQCNHVGALREFSEESS
jgi:DNA-directed RNA polymerase subunit RPC12/RpoP